MVSTETQVMRALDFARAAHVEQKRKGLDEAYILHPMKVAMDADSAGLSEDAVVAALLHDVVEDTAATFGNLEAWGFSARSIALVRLLTKTWTDDSTAEVKAAGKRAYYDAILQDYEAVALKLLDRSSNLDDIVRVAADRPKWARKYLAKTHAEITALADANTNVFVASRFKTALAVAELEIGKLAV